VACTVTNYKTYPIKKRIKAFCLQRYINLKEILYIYYLKKDEGPSYEIREMTAAITLIKFARN